VAENQVLESNVTVGTKSDEETTNEQEDELKHPAR